MAADAARPSGESPADVVVIHCPGGADDQPLGVSLSRALAAAGCQVWDAAAEPLTISAAVSAQARLRQARMAVVVVSEAALHNELHDHQVQAVRQAAAERGQPPPIVVVRHRYDGPLPPSLDGAPVREVLPCDDLAQAAAVARRILDEPAAGNVPGAGGAPAAGPLEPVGGAVPLGSPFYLERPSDARCREAVGRRDAIILIQGARQVGKTSLLARGLQAAREAGCCVAVADLQAFCAYQLRSLETFYVGLGEALAEQLGLGASPAGDWQPHRSPNRNFEQFVRRRILAALPGPLVWGLDEVDRLFATPYATEVFALFRSWHNARALDPAGPWAGLTVLFTYATEAHLFIADLNQSPFNVGTRLTLRDFELAETAELNRRYGSPLADGDVVRIYQLVAGQPYLTRRALHEVVGGLALSELESVAASEHGPFGDHLQRLLATLATDPALLASMRAVLESGCLPDERLFWRLASAGLVTGTPSAATPRCAIYGDYLAARL